MFFTRVWDVGYVLDQELSLAKLVANDDKEQPNWGTKAAARQIDRQTFLR